MRIIHVIFTFRTGGAETMLIDIMNRQVALGHEVMLLIINDGIDQGLISTINENVKVSHWPRRPGTQKLLLAARLNLWLRVKRPDVIHVHDPKLPGLIRGLDRKMVYTIHALNLSQRYLRPSVKQVAITQAVHDDVVSHHPEADIIVIPNGVDVDSIRQRDPERVPSEGEFRIVQTARLDSEKKGQDILIRALGALDRMGISDIFVDFIGEGADRHALEELALAEKVASRVTFRGLMTRPEVYNAYADYDLMVHPSRKEGFGLIIAEAMVAGLPVAVPSEGGPYEVIECGHLGETFETEDPESCAEAILNVRNAYPSALLRAELAKQRAMIAYSLNSMVDEYIDLYKTLPLRR